jgi:hypothetical protein
MDLTHVGLGIVFVSAFENRNNSIRITQIAPISTSAPH